MMKTFCSSNPSAKNMSTGNVGKQPVFRMILFAGIQPPLKSIFALLCGG
jgi:hypothetical protein